MNVDLSDKCVLVTGASRGIGKAVAIAMASSGARVAVHYHKSQHEAEQIKDEFEPRIELFQANLENENETTQLFENVISSFGKLDVIVNNAGIAIESNIDMPNNDWLVTFHKTLNINLIATGLICKLAIAHFIKNSGGRIINIASRAAFRGDTQDYLAYAASKGGVVSLTRTIARAFGKQGIKAFTIAPGFVMTDMADEFIKKYGANFVKDDVALNNITEPEDVAPMVTFLASGLADHATGTTIDINAGSYVH